jgi:CBS domain-containing protein
MASIILVKEIMSKDVKVVRPDTSAQEIVATLNKFNIGSVVVVQKEKPVGIITIRDILVRLVEQNLAPRVLTASQMMTSPFTSINVEATVEEAAKLMAKKRVKTLPVMEKEKLVGIISFTDIAFKVPALLSLLEESCRASQ